MITVFDENTHGYPGFPVENTGYKPCVFEQLFRDFFPAALVLLVVL